MNCNGRIVTVSRDFDSRAMLVTLELENASEKEMQVLRGFEKLSISLKKWRQKRSLDANAYYWELTTRLSEALKISKPMAHNMMLRRYGQREFLDGAIVRISIPDTEEAEKSAMEADTYHIKPTSQVIQGNDGVMYRTYVMLRGSSTYDTREMGILIDGLVSECNELGIETLPPDEIERMKAAWRTK